MNERNVNTGTGDSHATQIIMKLLEESKEHVEEIVDDLPMVYAVVTSEGEIVRGNRDLGLLYNAPFEGLIGRKLSEVFHASDWSTFGITLQQAARSGIKNEIRLPVYLKGKVRFYTWTVVRLERIASRTLVAIIGQDVTNAEINMRRIEQLIQLFDKLVRTSQLMMDGRSMQQALAISLNAALEELSKIQINSARLDFVLPNRKAHLTLAQGTPRGQRLNVEWEGRTVGHLTVDCDSLDNPELLMFIKLLGQSTYLILSHLSFQSEMEEKVRLGTLEIAELNAGLNLLLNSLDEGYCVFDLTGNCLPISSRRMREFFGGDPAGLALADIIGVPQSLQQTLRDWLALIRDHRLPFDALAELSPVKWWEPEVGGRKIELRFHPVLNDTQKTTGIAMVATDRTQQLEAEKNVKVEAEKSFMILRIIENLPGFFECWSAMASFIADYQLKIQDSENTIRFAHTLKSSLGYFGWEEMSVSLNQFENEFRTASPDVLQGWRQRFANVQEQFRIKFPQVIEILIKSNSQADSGSQDDRLHDILSSSKDLDSLRRKLTDQFLFASIRSCLDPLLARLHHRAAGYGVTVAVNISGEDFKIFRRAYRPFFVSLEHLFNNIVDHGFAGYADEGQSGLVEVHMHQDHQNIIIEIRDDGKGIDGARLLRKSEEQGRVLTKAERQNPLLLIFASGMSTMETATARAGKGIGMEVVAYETAKIRGTIDIESAPSQGTKFKFTLPKYSAVF